MALCTQRRQEVMQPVALGNNQCVTIMNRPGNKIRMARFCTISSLSQRYAGKMVNVRPCNATILQHRPYKRKVDVN